MAKRPGPKRAEDIFTDNLPAQKLTYREARKVKKAAKDTIKALKPEDDILSLPEEPGDASPDKMLSSDDMAWIFGKWGGRKKLLKQIKEDKEIEREFLKMMLRAQVKEQEIHARTRADITKKQGGDGKQKTKLFVVKNLHSEENSAIDKILNKQKQISNILRPEEDSRLLDGESVVIQEVNRDVEITDEEE